MKKIIDSIKRNLPAPVRTFLRSIQFAEKYFLVKFITLDLYLAIKNIFFSYFEPNPIVGGGPVRVKFITNFGEAEKGFTLFGKYLRNKNIEIVSSRFADVYVIVNHPYTARQYFNKKRTIVFYNEPAIARRRWYKYANPNEADFLYVETETNMHDWHIDRQYSWLARGAIKKTKETTLSSITSSLYSLAGHKKRLDFLAYIDKDLQPDVFGAFRSYGLRDGETILKNLSNFHGPLAQKDDGLFPYKYHFAAENESEDGWFTEKLTDSILAECLTFYWGCPNISKYLDERAFIRLDLDDFEGSLAIVKHAIANNTWEERLPHIKAAKNKILEELQIMVVIEKVIARKLFDTQLPPVSKIQTSS